MTTIPLQRARSVPELPSYLLVFALVWAQLALVLAQPSLLAPLPQSTAEAAVPPVDFGKLPLSFVPNAGQEDARVQFKTQAMGGTVFFTPEEIALRLPTSRSSTAADTTVRVQYDGANRNPTIAGEQQLPGVFNSMIGNDPANWHTNIPTYGGIVYQGLYAGIDLRYEGSAGNLKSTYFVAPGSDPAQLRWHYNGASSVGVDRASGDLNIALPGAAAPIIERAPVAWQEIGGMRVPVAARYAIAQDGSIGFALGSYNPAYTLTIDPVLSFSTYLGGAGFDAAYDIAVDSINNVYVTGRTDSTTFVGQAASSGGDAFVVKLSPAGAVLYTTILGGSNFDEGRSIAVDGAGNAYITGSTFSSNFAGAGNTIVGSSDVFVTRLDAAGANPTSRFLGGSAADVGNGIAIDGTFIVVTGYTDATNATLFPVTNGSTPTGGTDVFYSKLDASLTVSYSTYLGGLSNEEGRDIAVDGSGNVYIVGRAGPGFPLTSAAPQATFGGGNSDAFIVKYNAADVIVASTYLGGNDDDEGYGIAVDGSGNAYVTGSTRSTNFPTVSPLQPNSAGLNDAFVSMWDGSAFTYSTYLGGGSDDIGRAIALVGGDIVVAGRTRSYDFPKPAAQALNGAEDAFVTRINPGTNSLVYSTYVGGNNDDMGYGVGIQSDGTAVVAGQTNSTSGLSKPGAAQAAYGGGSYDAFVSKVTQPTVSFAGPASENHNENNVTPFNVTVQLSAASNQDVTVPIDIAVGATATYGTDYTTTPALPTTVTIPAGSTSATAFAVTVVNDAFPEPTEIFTPTLGTPTNATLGAQPTKTINIIDDDSPPTVSIGDVTVAEGDSGTTPAAFNVTLSKGFVYTVTVDYATANGTATAPSDYVAASGSLTFAPGEITKPITVTVNGDTTYEADETFAMNLTNARYTPPGAPVPVTITRNKGTGTITNDDSAIGMTISGPASVTEGNAGTTNADFTVTLTATAGITVSVNYATANGTATAGSDYTTTAGTLTFAPGQTSKVVSVPVLGDTLDEDDETFTLNLSNPNPAAILLPVPPQASATIVDDDAAPTASINDVSVTEGNSGETNAVFNVTLSAASGKVITMTATTADGTATAGADYTATTTTLVFQPGQTTQTVTVPVLGDTVDEDDETFVVNLGAPENVTIADGQGVGTIIDDDAAPTLAISDVTLPEGDSGTTAFNFTVTLSGATARTVTVDYGTADNTATTADNDYSAASGTLTFTPGEITKTVTVNVNGDTTDEADEQFFVNLSNPTNATISKAQGVGTITDDDGPVLTVSPGSVVEGNSGTATMVFTATLATTSLQDVSVTYATQDGTATAGTDYVAVPPTTLVFPAGTTEKQFSVTVNGDRVTEGDEQFTIVLSNVVQAKLAAPSVTGTIINDDTTPVAADDAFTTDEDTVLTVAAADGVLANDVDPDAGEALTVALVNGPASGTLALQSDGSFTYTPVANFYGVVTFTYQATDLGGNVSNVAIATITINSVNDPATAADDFASVGKNVPTHINVLANDSPGPDPEDSLTITEITFAPTSGTVAITNNGTDVTYTPNLNYQGSDTFVYRVCDNGTPQYCATARVTVSVGQFRVSMPLIAKIPQPDLVATLSVSQPNVQAYQRVVFTAKVTNQGTAPASNFWVDLHLNPQRVPRVNEPWNEICNPRACRGVAWFVTQTLQPGESIDLTTTPDSYVKENTVWLGFFEPGDQRLYLYVDSWNRDSSNTQRNPNGSVEESNEANNLFELDLNVTKGNSTAAPAQTPELPNVADLAPRSLEPRSQQ